MHLLHRLASLCKARGVLFKQVFFVGVPKVDQNRLNALRKRPRMWIERP